MYYFKQFDLKKENIKQTQTLIRDVIGQQSKKRENLPLFFKQNQDILNNPTDIADGSNDFFVGIGPQLAAEVGPANLVFTYCGQACYNIHLIHPTFPSFCC